jgi:hypothetical protein
MKKLLLISGIAIAVIMNACSSTKSDSGAQTFKLDTTTLKTGQEFYQCPMHPSVLSNKPGACPQCGMALEKIKKS